MSWRCIMFKVRSKNYIIHRIPVIFNYNLNKLDYTYKYIYVNITTNAIAIDSNFMVFVAKFRVFVFK